MSAPTGTRATSTGACNEPAMRAGPGLTCNLTRPRSNALTIVDAMTDPADICAVDDEGDETACWLSLPGLRESLAEADADYAAGRTFGEQEIRARYGLPPLHSR